MLNTYYQIPIFVLTALKLKIKQCQLKKMTKKEEPLNLILGQPSKVKSFAFPVGMYQKDF